MNIHEKLSAIQQKIKVHKGQYNDFGKYNYRSAEDILEALKPLEKEFKVTFLSSEDLQEFSQGLAVVSKAWIIDNESLDKISVTATALIDFEVKGMQMPQRTGAASSYAKKYAYGNLLLLDDTKDSDAVNDHGKGSKPVSTPKKQSLPPARFNAAVDNYNKGDDNKKKEIVATLQKDYSLTTEQTKEFFNKTKFKL